MASDGGAKMQNAILRMRAVKAATVMPEQEHSVTEPMTANMSAKGSQKRGTVNAIAAELTGQSSKMSNKALKKAVMKTAGRLKMLSEKEQGKFDAIPEEEADNENQEAENLNRSIIHTLKADGEILSCCFSPDGRYLVYGHGHLSVVKTDNWELVAEFEGSDLDDCTFSANGQYMGFTGEKTCTVVDPSTWQVVGKPIEAEHPIHTCCFSNTGSWLVYGGDTRVLTMVSTVTWETIREFYIGDEAPEEPTGRFYTCSFSPNGQYLAFTHDHKVSVVWRGTWDQDFEAAGDNALKPTQHLCWDPDNMHLAFCNWKTITIIEVKDWQMEHTMKGNGEIHTITYSPRGNFFFYGGEDKKVVIVSTDTWAVVREMISEDAILTCNVCHDWSNERELLGFGGKGGRLEIMNNVANWWSEAELIPQTSQVNACAFSPDGKLLAYGTNDGACTVLERMDDWRKVAFELTRENMSVFACSFSPQGGVLAFAGSDQMLVMLSTSSWQVVAEIKLESSINAISYRPDGQFIACALGTEPEDGTKDPHNSLVIVDTSAHSVTATFDFPEKVTTCSFPSLSSGQTNSTYMACAGQDEKITIISTRSWHVRRQIQADDGIFACAYNPTGDLFAYGGEDMKCTVLDTTLWQPVVVLPTEGDFINDVGFSPNGEFLCYVTQGASKLVVVSCATWVVVKDLQRPGWTPNFLACKFSPDAELLVCGGNGDSEEAGFKSFMSWRVEGLLTKPSLRSARALVSNPLEVLISELVRDPVRILDVAKHLAKANKAFKLRALCVRFPYIVVLDFLREPTQSAFGDSSGMLVRFIKNRDAASLLDVWKASHLMLGAVKTLTPEIMRVCNNMSEILVDLLNMMVLPRVQELHIDYEQADYLVCSMHDLRPTLTRFERTEKEGLPASLLRTPCPGLSDLDFLEMVMDTGIEEAFNTPAMGLVIHGLLNQLSRIFYFRATIYLLYCIGNLLIAAYISFGNTTIDGDLVFFPTLGLCMLNIIFELLEVKYAFGRGEFWQRLRDPWNLLDNLSTILTLFNLVALGVLGKTEFSNFERSMVCMTVLLSIFNSFQYLKGFNAFAPLIIMITAVIQDLGPFLVILVMFVSSFAVVFMLDLPQVAPDPFNAIYISTIFAVFNHIDPWSDAVMEAENAASKNQDFSMGMFTFFMVAVQVVLLNLIIAIITATHERVNGIGRVALQRTRAEMVIQQMAVMKACGCGFYDTLIFNNTHLFRLNPASRKKKSALTEWAGYSNAAKDHLNSALRLQLDSFKAEVNKVKNDVYRNASMREEMDDIKGDLELIMKKYKISRSDKVKD